MFRQFKNIDTAFRHIRLFSLFFLAAATAICGYVIYTAQQSIASTQGRIYVLVNGKLFEAVSTERKDQLTVEARDHVKMFHFYFYTLEPDEKVINGNCTKALYLADASAKAEYDNLRESGYYSGLVSANISQQIEPDSIVIHIDRAMPSFRYYGKQRIIRSTSIVTRSLITEGYIRTLQNVSDNNPHGFLIEQWKIIENRDINIEKR